MGRPAGRSFFFLPSCAHVRERPRNAPRTAGREKTRRGRADALAGVLVRPAVRPCSSVSVRFRPWACLRPSALPLALPSAPVLAGVAVRSCVRPSACLRASPTVRVCPCGVADGWAGLSVRPRLVRPHVRALRPRPHHAPVRTPPCVHVCGRAHYTRALCAKRDPEHLDRIRRSAAPGAAPGDPDPLQAACRSRREAKSCVKRLLKKFYKMY